MAWNPIVPDGQHLRDSQQMEGATSGLLFEDGTNKLMGPAKWVWESDDSEDEDQLEDYSSGATLDVPFSLVLGGLAVAGITISAVAASEAFRRRRQERRKEIDSVHAADDERVDRASAPPGWYELKDGRQAWWTGEEWSGQVRMAPDRQGAPAGWYDDGTGTSRWWDGRLWTAHVQNKLRPDNREPGDGLFSARDSSNSRQLSADYVDVTMSSTEWKIRFRQMFLARAFSDSEWELLSHASIDDGEEDLRGWQRELRQMSSEEFADAVNRVVDSGAASKVQSLEPDGAPNWANKVLEWKLSHRSESERIPSNAEKEVSAPVTLREPGWYESDSGQLRWWDGERWPDF